jgi:hypothetical protein
MRDDCLDPADLSIGQPNLDTMGMIGGFGQDILDNTAGQFTAALVPFQYDFNFCSGFYIPPDPSIHQLCSFYY